MSKPRKPITWDYIGALMELNGARLRMWRHRGLTDSQKWKIAETARTKHRMRLTGADFDQLESAP